MTKAKVVLELEYHEYNYGHPINWNWNDLLGLEPDENVIVSVYHEDDKTTPGQKNTGT